MPKFVFELPDNWKCNQCPYCQDPEGGGFCECQFEVLHGDERFGKELGLVNTDMLHPHWCPLNDANATMSDPEQRIRELEAENDALTRRNKDLAWQLEVCHMSHHDKAEHIAELRQLLVYMHRAFVREAPSVAKRFDERIGRWIEVWE